MTKDELMAKIHKILPEAIVAEDDDGEIVIYTHMVEPSLDEGSELISYKAAFGYAPEDK